MRGNVESLSVLAEQVESIEKRKKDYLYNSKDMEMNQKGNGLSLNNNGLNSNFFILNDNAHQQLASKLDIPKKYYDKMLGIPGLRKQNVDAWFKEKKQRYLVRTLDNNCRAFLSDTFKPVDNYLILSGFLPVLQNMEVRIKSCSLTETKMYVQVVFPKTETKITVGDPVQFGVTLTNSEVGRGAVAISTLVWRLVCNNGMVAENIMNKYHKGRRIGDDFEDYDIYQSDTIQAELESFKKRLRDIFIHCLKIGYFESITAKMRNATKDEINDVSGTVGEITKRYIFSEKENEKILVNIGKEAGKLSVNQKPNRWMLANSITAMAHDIEDQEKQFEYEKTGWDITNMSKGKWEELKRTVEKNK
jgi:hypothetical protein